MTDEEVARLRNELTEVLLLLREVQREVAAVAWDEGWHAARLAGRKGRGRNPYRGAR